MWRRLLAYELEEEQKMVMSRLDRDINLHVTISCHDQKFIFQLDSLFLQLIFLNIWQSVSITPLPVRSCCFSQNSYFIFCNPDEKRQVRSMQTTTDWEEMFDTGKENHHHLPPQIVNNHKTKPNHADNTCFQDRPQIKIPIDCQLFQGGALTCSSRCARRSRQEIREDQKEDKETNLYGAAHVGASGGVFEADEERSDADFSELQPWQPLKRMEMRRGALIWRLWRLYDYILCFHVLCIATGIRNEYDLVVIWSYYSHDNQRDIGYQRAKETDLHQYRSSTQVAFRRREICRKKRTITLYPNIIFQK